MDLKSKMIVNNNNIFLVYSESNKLIYWSSAKTVWKEKAILNNFTDEIEYFKIFKKKDIDHLLVLLKNKLLYIFRITYNDSEIKQLDTVCYTEILKKIEMKFVKNIQFFHIEKDAFYLYLTANLFVCNISILSIYQEKDDFQIEVFNYKYPDFGLTKISPWKESDSTSYLILEQILSKSNNLYQSNFIKLYLKHKEKDILIDESNILILSSNYKSKIIKNYLLYIKNYLINFVSLENFSLISCLDIRSLLNIKHLFILSIKFKYINESLIVLIISNELLMKIVIKLDTFKTESSETFKINPNYINQISSRFTLTNTNSSRYVMFSENLSIFSFDLKGKNVIENTFNVKQLQHLKPLKRTSLIHFTCIDIKDKVLRNFSDDINYVNSRYQSEFSYFSKYSLSDSLDTVIKLKQFHKDLDLGDEFFSLEVVKIFIEEKVIVIKVVYYYKIISYLINFKGDLLLSFENEIVRVEIKDHFIFCLIRNFLQVHDQSYKVVFSLDLEYSFDIMIEDKKLFVVDFNSVKILIMNKDKISVSSEFHFKQINCAKESVNYLCDNKSKIFAFISDNSSSIFSYKDYKIKELKSNLNDVLSYFKENEPFITLANNYLFILSSNKVYVYLSSKESEENINFDLRFIISYNIPLKVLDFSVFFSQFFILFLSTKTTLFFISFSEDYKGFLIEHINDYQLIHDSSNIFKRIIKNDEIHIESKTLNTNFNSSEDMVPSITILKNHDVEIIDRRRNSSYLLYSKTIENENNPAKHYLLTNSFNFDIFMEIKFSTKIDLIDILVNRNEKLICLILLGKEEKLRKLIFLRYIKGSPENYDKEMNCFNTFSMKFLGPTINISFLKIIDIDPFISRVEYIQKLGLIFNLTEYGKITIYEISGTELVCLYESFYSFSKSELKEINLEYSDEADLITLYKLDNELNFINKYTYFDYIYLEDDKKYGIEESFIILIFNHGCLVFSVLRDLKIKLLKKIKFFQQFSLDNVQNKLLNKFQYLNQEKNYEMLIVFDMNTIRVTRENKKFSFSYFN